MPGEAGGMGGLWSILIFMAIMLITLYVFFEVLGFTPNTAPTGAAAAK